MTARSPASGAFAGREAGRRSVLHVPYTYFPDPIGGTEVYVQALARLLAARGYPSSIAAPTSRPAGEAGGADYEHEGLAVRRFATDRRGGLPYAYGAPDATAAANFRRIVEAERPSIVHLHARTSAISDQLIDVAHAAGSKVVFTYHSPTVSCARGTMMLFGEQPCDGVIERRRCTACTLAARGLPLPLARAVGAAPEGLLRVAAAGAGNTRPFAAVKIPALVAGNRARFDRFIGKVDHVVAVCAWVRDVLERNGVPPAKITLSRQGIAAVPARARPQPANDDHGPLKIAYFGRVDRTKGPDLLARALAIAADADVAVDIFALRPAGGCPDVAWLEAAAARDPRFRIRTALPPGKVIGAMSAYDVVAIPSRWLETGPLVALEAFAAGVPVLGAALGGIAELVHDGIDGVLVPPDDPAAWAAAIGRLAGDRSVLRAMRTRLPVPRSMAATADDMAALYAAALGQEAGRRIDA